MEKKEYSWYPDGGYCEETYKSIEDAISDAQKRFDNMESPYEDGDEYVSSLINVGEVQYFDVKKAVINFLESIEDNIGDELSSFCSGIDGEAECYISSKDRKAFLSKATEVLYPIVKKHFYTAPDWICGCEAGQYDLKSRCWVEK